MSDEWDSTYLKFAEAVAKHSKAIKARVGCVIVKGEQVIATGYNGTPPGWSNICEDRVSDGWKEWTPEGATATIRTYDRRLGLKTRPEVIHAEINAIAKVAKSTVSCDEATLYVTKAPCIECAKAIIMAGISRVVFSGDYEDADGEGVALLQQCDVLVQVVLKDGQFTSGYNYAY